MFKNEGGGGFKGRLNNVQKNRRFGSVGRPLTQMVSFSPYMIYLGVPLLLNEEISTRLSILLHRII